MARYGKKSRRKVKRAMHEMKRGKLKSGRSGKRVKSRVQALASAFALASERGWQSVSFPAVSAGIFAVPLDICARAYVKAARAARLSKVRLCLRDQPVIDAVLKELKK